MPGPIATYLLGPFAAGNAANIVAAQTPAGAGNLALVGGGPVVLDAPRRVLVTFGIEAAPRTVKVFGTSVFGTAINEIITVASGGAATAISKQDFLTVTQVQVFAAWSVNMSVGTQGAAGAVGFPVASSPWFFVDTARDPSNVNVAVTRVDSQAAYVNGYIIEGTLDDPNAAYLIGGYGSYVSSLNPQSNNPPLIYQDGANLGNFAGAAAAKKANAVGLINQPFFALRVASYEATPIQFSAQFIQAGIRGA